MNVSPIRKFYEFDGIKVFYVFILAIFLPIFKYVVLFIVQKRQQK